MIKKEAGLVRTRWPAFWEKKVSRFTKSADPFRPVLNHVGTRVLWIRDNGDVNLRPLAAAILAISLHLVGCHILCDCEAALTCCTIGAIVMTAVAVEAESKAA